MGKQADARRMAAVMASARERGFGEAVTPAFAEVEAGVSVYRGDALAVLRGMEDGSVDSLVTDPPSAMAFMGSAWDTFKSRAHFEEHIGERMAEALRVAKPGALGLVWAIPRTAHWTADALEEAGWEIHPNGFIPHHFGSGFPKARTHLKPATEVWWIVRKPGRGEGLRIEDCRIEGVAEMPGSQGAGDHLYGGGSGLRSEPSQYERHPSGRWPANLVLSHAEGCRPVGSRRVRGTAPPGAPSRGGASVDRTSLGAFAQNPAMVRYAAPDGTEAVEAWECAEGCPVAELDRQSGTLQSGFMAAGTQREGLGYRGRLGSRVRNDTIGDRGGASRFFYVAKASAAERSAGLPPGERNQHPTVKPLGLMRWLCRLVTPPGGTVLDPFMGSGTTGCAALLEGFSFVGIEQDEESVRTAVARIRYWGQHGHQAGLELAEEVAPEPVPAVASVPRCRRCGLTEAESPRFGWYPDGPVCLACQKRALVGEVG